MWPLTFKGGRHKGLYERLAAPKRRRGIHITPLCQYFIFAISPLGHFPFPSGALSLTTNNEDGDRSGAIGMRAHLSPSGLNTSLIACEVLCFCYVLFVELCPLQARLKERWKSELHV